MSLKTKLLSLCPIVIALCLALGLTTSTGCVGLASNLLHAIYGHEVAPEFQGLKKQRIAILCSNEQGYLQDDTTKNIEMTMRKVIASKLKKATFVEPDEMTRWLDDSSSTGNVVKHVGKGVNADIVISVSIKNLKLREGKTMYRGSSDVDVDVYDIAQEKYVFTKSFPGFTYPQNAAVGTTEMEESRFKRLYLLMVGERLTRLFIPSPMGADLAIDARMLEFQ